MYEELIAELRLFETVCKHSNKEDLQNLAKRAADAVEGLSHAVDQMTEWRKNPWIPVTERLPLLNTPVLATDGIEVDILWMYGGPPRWITSYMAIDEDKITHWMPLPQTPKEE